MHLGCIAPEEKGHRDFSNYSGVPPNCRHNCRWPSLDI